MPSSITPLIAPRTHYSLVGEGDEALRLCWFEWGSEHRASGTILLLHATGFHARCWDQLLRHLDGQHVIAVDLRGHGRSDKQGPYNWDIFGRDMAQLIQDLALEQLVGVGHSLGGHLLSIVASKHPARFQQLLLLDPVIFAPDIYQSQQVAVWQDDTEEHPVAKRNNFFPDADSMFQRFSQRQPYASWQVPVLRDYCNYGLLPNPDGAGYVLACPPAVEAAIYRGSASTDIYDLIRQIEIPTLILRVKERDMSKNMARPQLDFSLSPTWHGLADCFPRGRDVYLPELTHFIPMQAPELVAQYIMQAVNTR